MTGEKESGSCKEERRGGNRVMRTSVEQKELITRCFRAARELLRHFPVSRHGRELTGAVRHPGRPPPRNVIGRSKWVLQDGSGVGGAKTQVDAAKCGSDARALRSRPSFLLMRIAETRLDGSQARLRNARGQGGARASRGPCLDRSAAAR